MPLGRGEHLLDPWTIRRERRIGNWGRASEHIGKRWEEVGLVLLQPLLEGERPWPRPGVAPEGWFALSADPELQTTLSRVGLTSPDVVVGLRTNEGDFVLQGIDLKWHLEFATYKQISGDALRELVARQVPGLHELLVQALPWLNGSVAYQDGLLFAPDIPTNHAFLGGPQNERQDYPIAREDVLFAPVDGREFFSPLPGWEMALMLAEYDRAPRAVQSVEGAERYYRLGAGLQGATAQLLNSIFVEQPPAVPAPEAFAWLTQTFRARPAGVLAQEVDKAMAARAQLLNRLKELLRSPFRLGALGHVLRQHGLGMPASIDEDTPYAAKCRDLMRQVALSHKLAVRRAGLQLVAKGDSDVQALATLARQPEHFVRLAEAHAKQLLDRYFPLPGKP